MGGSSKHENFKWVEVLFDNLRSTEEGCEDPLDLYIRLLQSHIQPRKEEFCARFLHGYQLLRDMLAHK